MACAAWATRKVATWISTIRYGDVEKLKPLAQELIALKPDVLVADSPSAAMAFQSVAPRLPIAESIGPTPYAAA